MHDGNYPATIWATGYETANVLTLSHPLYRRCISATFYCSEMAHHYSCNNFFWKIFSSAEYHAFMMQEAHAYQTFPRAKRISGKQF